MNDFDAKAFEAELGRLRPARPPEHLVERLAQTLSKAPRRMAAGDRPARSDVALTWLWRLLPLAGAAAALTLLLLREPRPPPGQPARPALRASTLPTLQADGVEIDRHLITSFDAVARLPGGEPIRFRCQEWMDGLVLRDSARGIEIEHRQPRLEIVPVGYEAY